MTKSKQLNLNNKDGQNVQITADQSVLFIGANGSGKTRLGAWIDVWSSQKDQVHRISAQKILNLPNSTTPIAIDKAENDLRFGHTEWVNANYKLQKWQDKPATLIQNDFQKLMVYLFSDEIEENSKFTRACKLSRERIEPSLTKLDQVKKIWEKFLPHRELVIGGLRIETRIKGREDKIYNSSEMSDGERVIFYLIGQCLAATENGIIVVDEPELHLHKSIQIPLWSEIEKLRSDCLFVYLTHDVDFASSKENSKKIWLKAFDGYLWDWEEVADDENLPQELLLEILGNRKPVVFVEGENGSYDVSLYREILSDFLVIPRGSCTQVIQSVKALKANNQLHHLQVYGIIDRDRRTQNEINKLEQDSIFVLNVAEVENLFCTQEILKIVSNRLGRDSIQDFQNVSNTIFSSLNREIQTQVSLRVNDEIKFLLQMFDTSKKTECEIQSSLDNLMSNIDVNKLYSNSYQLLNNVIQERNYSGLLAVYNRKSLASQISASLGLSNGSLPETVVRLSKSHCKDEIRDALKPYFGNFQQYIN